MQTIPDEAKQVGIFFTRVRRTLALLSPDWVLFPSPTFRGEEKEKSDEIRPKAGRRRLKMHKIKQIPEDFFVREISSVKIEKEGNYSYFLLRKKNWNTIAAVGRIANLFGVPARLIGFAGNKDKIAVTEQVCSVLGVSRERIDGLKLDGIELKFLDCGKKPVSLGDLEGNQFEIVVRNIDEKPTTSKKNAKFVNYFGEQRFSEKNAEVGKAIVKRDFRKAAELLIKDEPKMANYLSEHAGDYVGALKRLPLRLLKLLVASYQSEIWNKLAGAVSRKAKKNVKLPIVGFGTEETPDVRGILAKEELTTRDFVIREFPELSSEGGERELFAEAKDLEAGELEEDELNAGKKKILLKFTLQKGSYATEFVRQLFGE